MSTNQLSVIYRNGMLVNNNGKNSWYGKVSATLTRVPKLLPFKKKGTSELILPGQEVGSPFTAQSLVGYNVLSLNYRQIRRQAALEERHRLARELHDNVAPLLGYLNLKVASTDALLSSGQPVEAQTNLRELKHIIDEVYLDVRQEIANLRTETTAQWSGFLNLLRQRIAKYQRCYHLEVNLIIEAEEALLELPAETGVQVVRIIQEALNNTHKHAGVNEVSIHLRREREQLYISVEDQGRGFDLARSRAKETTFGLQILSERAESVGGSLEIITAPGQGTRLIIRVPAVQ